MNNSLKELDQIRMFAWENKWSSKLHSQDRFTPGNLVPEKVFNLSFTKTIRIESLNTPTYSIKNLTATESKRKYLKTTFTNLNSLPHILSLISDPIQELIEAPDAVDNVDYSAELRQYETLTPQPNIYLGYYFPLEKMVNTGWHFSDNLSPIGAKTPIRHGALTKNNWHGRSISHFPVTLPVLADFDADWLKVWEKFTTVCLDAYEKYPEQVVYRNIYGEIVPDLMKTRLMFS